MAFGQTSRANRAISNNNAVWRRLIGTHFPETASSVTRTGNAKEAFNKMRRKVFEARVRMVVGGYPNYVSRERTYNISYLIGSTTVEQVLQRIANAARKSLDQISITIYNLVTHTQEQFTVKDTEFCKQIFSDLLANREGSGFTLIVILENLLK